MLGDTFYDTVVRTIVSPNGLRARIYPLGDTEMSRKKNDLPSLHHVYLNQSPPPSEATMKYVVALRARIDALEMELAMKERELEAPKGTQG